MIGIASQKENVGVSFGRGYFAGHLILYNYIKVYQRK